VGNNGQLPCRHVFAIRSPALTSNQFSFESVRHHITLGRLPLFTALVFAIQRARGCFQPGDGNPESDAVSRHHHGHQHRPKMEDWKIKKVRSGICCQAHLPFAVDQRYGYRVDPSRAAPDNLSNCWLGEGGISIQGRTLITAHRHVVAVGPLWTVGVAPVPNLPSRSSSESNRISATELRQNKSHNASFLGNSVTPVKFRLTQ
jgi:hypothetical protein